MAAMIKRLLAPVSLDEAAFSSGLIKELGPGGVYLDQTDTIRNMRKALSLPLMSDRDSYDEWTKKGKIDSVSAARTKVKEILANHKPAPIEEKMLSEMSKLVTDYSK
jgi:trimethylamine--corrinoid protein Co-methyltransferase